MISVDELKDLYLSRKLSASEIAARLGCSTNKINYWLKIHRISKRSISDAIYIKCNPNGDPFVYKPPKNIDQAFLFGLGLGLYWGEGTKRNKLSVRLGNTDPKLIKYFLKFLFEIYEIKKEKLKFGLQVYGDINTELAIEFWLRELHIRPAQLATVITASRRVKGNYRHKAKYGVLTVYYHNKKLRDMLCSQLEKI